jgi:hypothetical protein
VAVATAGTVLGGMYLDAKFALAKDIGELRKYTAVMKLYAQAGELSSFD